MRLSSEVLIWDCDELPFGICKDGPNLVFWRSHSTHGFSTSVSIPRCVEDNAESLRKRYLAWIYAVGETVIQGKRVLDHIQLRPEFSAWWISLFAGKCNFALSPQIDDCIRLLAFTDWMDDQSAERVVLVSSNMALAECLKRWCNRKGLNFNWQRAKNESRSVSWLPKVYSRLPHALQALIWLVYHAHSRWAFRGAGQKAWQQSQGNITFVSYLFNLNPDSSAKGIFESGHWGSLPEMLLKQGVVTNWLHMYVQDGLLPAANEAARQIRRFNKTAVGQQNHVALDSFISISVLGKVLRDWYRLVCKSLALRMQENMPDLGQLDLWPLFNNDWKKSIAGVNSIRSLLYLNQFEAAFRNISKQQIGVYLHENQAWEFGLRHAWKSNQHDQIVGFAHSTVRYWDLRYFFDPRSYRSEERNRIPMPDRVAVNGPVAMKSYLTGGYPPEQLIEVEALRYLYLNEFEDNKFGSKCSAEKRIQVLILGDYLPSNTSKQMDFLREIAKEVSNFEFTVKAHPGCPIDAADYPELTFEVTNQPLSELLGLFDMAYTSNPTSAAVEAYSVGLKVITVLDPKTLNLSPLREITGVRFVSSSCDLRRALLEDSSDIGESAERVCYFNTDCSLRSWLSLILDRI